MKKIDRQLILSVLIGLIGLGIIFCSTLLPDSDRNGIVWCCIVGTMLLIGSPLYYAYIVLKGLAHKHRP